MTTSIAQRKNAARRRPGRDAADWLGLAASPTFALMAWSAAGGDMNAVCSATAGAPLIDAMALMYLLMSLFHAAPWLRLVSERVAPPRLTPPIEGD